MQEAVRQRLISLIEQDGVKQVHVSRCVHIPTPLLSRFKNKERELNQKSLHELDKFLTSKGF